MLKVCKKAQNYVPNGLSHWQNQHFYVESIDIMKNAVVAAIGSIYGNRV